MIDTHHYTTGRKGEDNREASPSTGAKGTARALDAEYGLGDRESYVITDGEGILQRGVLEPEYSKDFLEVST